MPCLRSGVVDLAAGEPPAPWFYHAAISCAENWLIAISRSWAAIGLTGGRALLSVAELGIFAAESLNFRAQGGVSRWFGIGISIGTAHFSDQFGNFRTDLGGHFLESGGGEVP